MGHTRILSADSHCIIAFFRPSFEPQNHRFTNFCDGEPPWRSVMTREDVEISGLREAALLSTRIPLSWAHRGSTILEKVESLDSSRS